MTTYIKNAGHFQEVDPAAPQFVKVAGHWEKSDEYEKVAGHWALAGSAMPPPVFAGAIGNIQAIVGEVFTRDVSPRFIGNQVDSYSLQNAPAGMVIDEHGEISWPSPVKGDTAGITVTAHNLSGDAASNAFGVSAIALGPELVLNGDFSTPIVFIEKDAYPGHDDEWLKLGDASNVTGELVLPVTAAGGWVRSPVIHGGTGKTYRGIIDQRETPWLMISSSDHTFNASRIDVSKLKGHIETTFVAKTDIFYAYLYHGVHKLAIYDNISIREILP